MEHLDEPQQTGNWFSNRPDVKKILAWAPEQSVVHPGQYPWEAKLGYLTNSSCVAGKENISRGSSRKSTKRNYAQHCLTDYCENTSLHGLKYIAAKNTFPCEKLLWFCLSTLAITGAIWILYPIFSRYSLHPITTAVESTSAPIYRIPFPGVTICNVNKATRDMIEKNMPNHPWYNQYKIETVEEVVNILSEIGALKLEKSSKDGDDIKYLMTRERYHLDELMRNVSQPLDRMTLYCWWQGIQTPCGDLFQRRRTDEGYCWSFNSIPMRKPGKGFKENHSFDYPAEMPTEASVPTETTTSDTQTTSPSTVNSSVHEKIKIRHVNGAGPNIGLSVLLNPDAHSYFAPSNEFYGFKVIVHHPEDFPSVSTKGFLVPAGREVYAAVSATSTDTDDIIKSVPKDKRDCFFQTDETLNFYTTYSYENCLLECQVSSMKKRCNCVPYLYAQLNTSVPCNYDGIQCINANIERFYSIKPPGSEVIEGLEATKTMNGCRCRSSCDDVSYVTEVTSAQFPVPTSKIGTIISDNTIDIKNLVLLRVFFKDLYYVKYKRSLVYTWIDVIAAFGGIVGLFIGFSFVSGAEFVYFFTLRPLLRWRKNFTKTNAPERARQ